MSYSQANEKYRKYEALVRADPSNSINKRKLEKYRSMTQRLGQRGGNNQATIGANKYVDLFTPKDSDKPNASKTSSTDDLVNKIHQMLEYAKQKNSMQGGSGSDSGKASGKTQIKGHRNMTGGVITIPDFNKTDFDVEKAIASTGLSKLKYTIDSVKAVQSAATENISQGMHALKQKNAVLEAKITALEDMIVSLQKNIDSLTDQLTKLKQALSELEKFIERTKPDEAQQNNPDTEKELELIKLIKAKIEELQAEKAQKQKQQSELNSNLESYKKNAESYIKQLAEKHTDLTGQYNELVTAYEQSMKNLKQEHEELRTMNLDFSTPDENSGGVPPSEPVLPHRIITLDPTYNQIHN